MPSGDFTLEIEGDEEVGKVRSYIPKGIFFVIEI